MNEKTNKLYIVKLGAILFAICFISTLLLTVCNYITKDKIAKLDIEMSNQAKAEVIPGADFEKIEITDTKLNAKLEELNFVEINKATINGEFAGFCVTVAPQGFGDKINMIVGVKPDLESYYGIKIISLSETPGLGAKASEKSFYNQYSDNKKGILTVVKNSPQTTENQINAISGATITSNAVTQGANNALEIVKLLNEKEAE